MDLFDIIEQEEDKEKTKEQLQAVCPHRVEEKTDTDWGPPWGLRMTFTCVRCGRIRGRC
jgi:hypothetical protein